LTGTIDRLSERGFGFIVDELERYFFHAKDLVDGDFKDLQEGAAVSFERSPEAPAENRRPHAINVTTIPVPQEA
jgi:cold shock CspA family protein